MAGEGECPARMTGVWPHGPLLSTLFPKVRDMTSSDCLQLVSGDPEPEIGIPVQIDSLKRILRRESRGGRIGQEVEACGSMSPQKPHLEAKGPAVVPQCQPAIGSHGNAQAPEEATHLCLTVLLLGRRHL